MFQKCFFFETFKNFATPFTCRQWSAVNCTLVLYGTFGNSSYNYRRGMGCVIHVIYNLYYLWLQSIGKVHNCSRTPCEWVVLWCNKLCPDFIYLVLFLLAVRVTNFYATVEIANNIVYSMSYAKKLLLICEIDILCYYFSLIISIKHSQWNSCDAAKKKNELLVQNAQLVSSLYGFYYLLTGPSCQVNLSCLKKLSSHKKGQRKDIICSSV